MSKEAFFMKIKVFFRGGGVGGGGRGSSSGGSDSGGSGEKESLMVFHDRRSCFP